MFRPRPGFVRALALPALALWLTTAAMAQRAAPDVLRAQVPSRELAAGEALRFADRACLCARRDGRPFLIWDRTDYLPIEDSERGAMAWLAAHREELGHGTFDVVAAGTRDWEGATVRRFTLRRSGIALADAEVWVCFDDRGCLGLMNRVPRGLAAAPPPPDPPPAGVELQYKVRRASGQRDRIVLAEVRRQQTPTAERIEFVDDGSVFARERSQRAGSQPDSAATFTDFFVGGFPDQLQADARGVIWVSDPTLNRLLEIDPQTGNVTPHSTSPWTQPDGLCVDPDGRVWTGLYTTGNGLGLFDRATNQFTRFAPPTSGAFAIPTWHHSGRIYLTEHSPATLHVFDSKTSTWQPSIPMPGLWPVSGTYESTSGDLFVMQWSSNSIARVRDTAVVANLPTPITAGPSFSATANGKVWFSYWSSTQIGELDLDTGTFTTHNQTVAGAGGPIDVGPNGHVYLGTRFTGYIIEYDPVSGTSTNHPISATQGALKDGLTVAPDGSVWFTSGNGYVVRMTLP